MLANNNKERKRQQGTGPGHSPHEDAGLAAGLASTGATWCKRPSFGLLVPPQRRRSRGTRIRHGPRFLIGVGRKRPRRALACRRMCSLESFEYRAWRHISNALAARGMYGSSEGEVWRRLAMVLNFSLPFVDYVAEISIASESCHCHYHFLFHFFPHSWTGCGLIQFLLGAGL